MRPLFRLRQAQGAREVLSRHRQDGQGIIGQHVNLYFVRRQSETRPSLNELAPLAFVAGDIFGCSAGLPKQDLPSRQDQALSFDSRRGAAAQ